jgi:NAD(P)-dependent dehydrogenase (short-subunit alcohol dehydrogenase family)
MKTHEGRIAVVTGAAVGFGRAISCELARRGADIVAVDVNSADDTVVAVQQIGRQALSLQADLSDPDQVAAIAADLLSFAGRVDILVNNAGVFPTRDVFELEFAEWKRIMGINLDSQR